MGETTAADKKQRARRSFFGAPVRTCAPVPARGSARMADARRRSSELARSALTDEQLALLLAAGESLGSDFGGSSSGGDSDDSESDSGDDGGDTAAVLWLRSPAVVCAWLSLAALLAAQPPGRRVPATLDVAVSTVRGAACSRAALLVCTPLARSTP